MKSLLSIIILGVFASFAIAQTPEETEDKNNAHQIKADCASSKSTAQARRNDVTQMKADAEALYNQCVNQGATQQQLQPGVSAYNVASVTLGFGDTEYKSAISSPGNYEFEGYSRWLDGEIAWTSQSYAIAASHYRAASIWYGEAVNRFNNATSFYFEAHCGFDEAKIAWEMLLQELMMP